ncbi:MAG: hypothetical protein HYR84_01250 [Planctomycetes bacterium]|nr:hypothetical protein [Planctomycetota bacterium]
MFLFADMNLSIEPAGPFALPSLGLPMLAIAAFLLAALTIWSYVGVPNVTARQVAAVLGLRLAALVVAFAMLLRPSLAFTELEGMETTKLLVLFDVSESMKAKDADTGPTRWEQLISAWDSAEVQRKLERLRTQQRIEVVRYLAAEELRQDQPKPAPDGKRTEIGAWLRQLRARHGHEKNLRGVLLFSDGADNGNRFAAPEEARAWRGTTPIQTFGIGDPDNKKYRKDIGLTRFDVAAGPLYVNARFTVKAVAQVPGFKGQDVAVDVFLEDIAGKASKKIGAIPALRIAQEKDQPIFVPCTAPAEPGEYKLTLKIPPHADEANAENNEISTYFQVIEEKTNILWIDRYRVYEPTYAIRTLMQEKQFDVYYFEPPTDAKGDAIKFYELDRRHYHVIVIGDLSARRFSLGDDKVFDKIRELVLGKPGDTKKRSGLLMLGGSETFANGGWHKHPAIADLLPVKLDPMGLYAKAPAHPVQARGANSFPFIKLDRDAKKNDLLWQETFAPLEGWSPLGTLAGNATRLLEERDSKDLLMAATIPSADAGPVVVFAGDSTSKSWCHSTEAIAGYKHFWTQLIFWLAQHDDQTNQLAIHLDKRRINANAGDVLTFTLNLRGKDGAELPGAAFEPEIVGPAHKYKPDSVKPHRTGTFKDAKEPGPHLLTVRATAKDAAGKDVEVTGKARFLVAFDDIEMRFPRTEHESLRVIASESGGEFRELDKLAEYLDSLEGQVNRESREKTTHWPDWTRVPASPHVADQFTGLWGSFALVSFLVFIALLGCEWWLRRWWGLV